MNRILKCMVVLILLSSMATLCYAQSQSSAYQDVGIAEAEESLRTFLSSIDNERSGADIRITSQGDFATSAGDYYEFETDEGNFKVYKKTGEVESAWFYQDQTNSGKSDLSKDESLKLAKEFAQEHYPAFDNLNMVLIDSEKSEGNNGRARYLFKWYEVENPLFDTEVYTSNYVIIAVEGGEIAGYIGVERETEVSLNPEISESEAMEKAVSAISLPADPDGNYEYDNKLCISYFDGKQNLAWYINIDNGMDSWGYASGGQAVIDAHNGDVLLKNPYM
ncbi:hypothetical protein [Methanolacinia paynteri]|uniref:hypothetical protein n=1 Tax=Methanolacinia paynteri TaxID=230356 RepID=UPI00064F2907|nr:hypothetical protein [Methanolacinia paynteri]